jgi:hypothetical protein
MGIINEVLDILDDKSKELKIYVYPDSEEIDFGIWDKEAMIVVHPIAEEIFFETAYNDNNYSLEQIREIADVMTVIKLNLPEIKRWLQ